MIQNLIIKNFQSHKETEISFNPGVNIIIGPSDSGKTAILRALNWAINNKPGGEAFRSNTGGDTSVTVKVDGIPIHRSKTKKGNFYFMSGEEYKAFGQGVPEDIQKVLNFNSVNSQGQMDGPFLLSDSDSPGKVAKVLNKAVNLDVIDTTHSNINSSLREAKNDLTNYQDDLKEKSQALSDLDFVQEFDRKLSLVESDVLQRDSIEDEVSQIKGCIGQIEEVKEELKGLEPSVLFLPKIEEIEELIYSRKEMENGLQSIKKDIRSLESIELDTKEIQLYLEMEQMVEEACQIQGDIQKYTDSIFQLQETSKKYDLLSSNLAKREERFTKYMPEVCPLCGK